MPNSKIVKPVALPPGRARLATKPAPTGSTTCTNTIGTVRVACSNGPTTGRLLARTTSGASATNSAACLRKRSASPAPHRRSMRTLRPTAQPASCNPCRNAARRACPSASSAARFMSTPTRRTRSVCCARAMSGHATAAPPRSDMNSRRLIGRSERPKDYYIPPWLSGRRITPRDRAVPRLLLRSNVSRGSKPECLPNARMSALASCGQAAPRAVFCHVPKPILSRSSNNMRGCAAIRSPRRRARAVLSGM